MVAVVAVVALGGGGGEGTAGTGAAQEDTADGTAEDDAGPGRGDGGERLQDDGSVVVAANGADAPVVEVYADYQCPACKQFETAAGSTLQRLAADGEAIVHYRPVSIFSQQPAPISGNSLRAAAAARAAADHGKYVEFSGFLFDNQPAEGRAGFAVDDLVSWGGDVGIDDPAFAERVAAESKVVDTYTGDYTRELMNKAQDELGTNELSTMTAGELIAWGDGNGVDGSFMDGTYVKETLEATNAASARYSGSDKFEGTPSIYINGSKLGNEAFDPRQLKKAILDASPGEADTDPA
nr:DsbA family protein [Nocardiopsis mwathae]